MFLQRHEILTAQDKFFCYGFITFESSHKDLFFLIFFFFAFLSFFFKLNIMHSTFESMYNSAKQSASSCIKTSHIHLPAEESPHQKSKYVTWLKITNTKHQFLRNECTHSSIPYTFLQGLSLQTKEMCICWGLLCVEYSSCAQVSLQFSYSTRQTLI